MKINYGYIKLVVLLLMIIGLYVFANQKNNQRPVGNTEISFLGNQKLFMTEANVSKLLKQNQQPIDNQLKEIIDLNTIETTLNNHAMVKNAEVFMTVDGHFSVEVEQKKPIARVNGKETYYVDAHGEYMPLSENYTARVPLVTGDVNKTELSNVHQLAKIINEDDSLKKLIIHIQQNKDNTFSFNIRESDVKVRLGTLNKLEKKLNNFKAFYHKAIKDKTLDLYSTVNLKFDTQVICTKKNQNNE